jgi:hypothetical protein
MAEINLVWSAFRVAIVNVTTFLLPTIENWIKPDLMKYDIWRHSIVALTHARCGWKVFNLLHLLSTP